MSNIPAEYADADFGFSAVDEATFKAGQVDTENTLPAIDENDLMRIVLNSLVPLENKIDRLLLRQQIDDSDDVQFAIARAEEEVKSKVTELEKIIMPLLVNLMKTSDKEYIRWPNRAPQIQATIDKVLAITRG
jgi:hypothetical protein